MQRPRQLRRFITARKQKPATAGDTLIEVLIAVAIVGAILAGAFTVTQKSAQAVRNSQEHGEMLQILNSQVEMVRSLALDASNTTAPVFQTTPRYFCINETTRLRDNLPGNPLALSPTGQNYGNCSFGTDRRYNVAVQYDPGRKVFVFNGRWDGLGGANNQEQLVYRIEPGQAAAIIP